MSSSVYNNLQFRVDLVSPGITDLAANPGATWFGPPGDYLIASVVSPQEAWSKSVAAGRVWVHKRFDLMPYAGQWDDVRITCGTTGSTATSTASLKHRSGKRTKPIIQAPRCKACLAKQASTSFPRDGVGEASNAR